LANSLGLSYDASRQPMVRRVNRPLQAQTAKSGMTRTHPGGFPAEFLNRIANHK
jgi:hypothetical protein